MKTSCSRSKAPSGGEYIVSGRRLGDDSRSRSLAPGARLSAFATQPNDDTSDQQNRRRHGGMGQESGNSDQGRKEQQQPSVLAAEKVAIADQPKTDDVERDRNRNREGGDSKVSVPVRSSDAVDRDTQARADGGTGREDQKMAVAPDELTSSVGKCSTSEK